MLTDRYNGEHSTSDRHAVEAFERAAFEFLAHRPGAGPLLDQALEHDSDHVSSLALKGFGSVLLARKEHVATARIFAARAIAAVGARPATGGERALAAALDKASSGEWLAAADILQSRLVDQPLDAVALKLAHGLRFLAGDQDGMLAGTASVINSWSPSIPGYGFALGCHAFALEEHGHYRAAEQTAKKGLSFEPADVWGLHAIAHVHTMEGRYDDGIAWLTQTSPVWASSNNFTFHLSWHIALLHFSKGEIGRALELYDREIRPGLSDDFRDIANAVSLLWRMRQQGIDTRERFAELHAFARTRAQDSTLVFASLHHLLTMKACGDCAGVKEILHTIKRLADRQTGDQSSIASDVGVELARVIAGLTPNAGAHAEFGRLARMTSRIGGSNEQRDVFLRTLALVAADDGDRAGAESVLAIRHKLKRETHFAGIVAIRIEKGIESQAVREVA